MSALEAGARDTGMLFPKRLWLELVALVCFGILKLENERD